MRGMLMIGITQCDCPEHEGQFLVVAGADIMGLVQVTTILKSFPTEARARRYAESEQAQYDATEWAKQEDGPVAEAVAMLTAAGFGGMPLRGIEDLIDPPSQN